MKTLLISLTLLVVVIATVLADSVTLAWDRAASHTNLNAFLLKYGQQSGNWTNVTTVPTNLTTVTISNLRKGQNYRFIVTARNVANLESDPSNELSYTVPNDVVEPPNTNAPGPPTLFREIP